MEFNQIACMILSSSDLDTDQNKSFSLDTKGTQPCFCSSIAQGYFTVQTSFKILWAMDS